LLQSENKYLEEFLMRPIPIFLFACFALGSFGLIACTPPGSAPEPQIVNDSLTALSDIQSAFQEQKSDFQVMQEGPIITVLADDTVGDRHQRFILRLKSNQTLLIAHNIDLAPRIPDPKVGEVLRFYGVYEWNDQGGVVHWTHHDPDGKHIDGWLEYRGKRYQ
jgi:Protein of unknown function (DUF3465)